MTAPVEIHLFGSLRHDPERDGMASYQLHLENPVTLSDLIKDTVALADRVQMAMINHKAVPLDTPVGPGDRVALFPKEYPLFVDWRGFRV